MRLTYIVYTLVLPSKLITKLVGPFDNRAIAKRYDVLNRDDVGWDSTIRSCITSCPVKTDVESYVKKDILFKVFEELGL